MSEVATAMKYLSNTGDPTTSISIDKDVRLVLNRRDVSPDDIEEYERAFSTAVAIAEERDRSQTSQGPVT